MTAKIIDGNAAARELRERLKKRAAALKERGITPGLAVIVVGDNPASRVYVRNKLSAGAEVGVRSELREFQAGCSEAVVHDEVENLNRNPGIHGILIQLPLPGHFDAGRVTQAIAPEKDVDGLNWRNLGALVATGHSLFEPCTPRAVLALIERAGMAIEGSHAVVVGRSAIVGKPVALMLTARGATVTVCHSRTRDLGQFTRLADILVVAAGRPELITGNMVKPGAMVLDVGINRVPGKGLVGDVHFTSVRDIAGAMTPVPGGVGPMTVAMLIANTVQAAEMQAARTADQDARRGSALAGS
ncbi:MAG: bifunctional methylenetetrahydrofolate dehydrogenase/methenyltetrahydrofolate cyclohydrolase FolD [Burkholderiales bacterium]